MVRVLKDLGENEEGLRLIERMAEYFGTAEECKKRLSEETTQEVKKRKK